MIADDADARDAYNDALACLDTDPDRAEQLLTLARRNAGTDAEVRFSATYNMGWVDVRRADALLEKEPDQALIRLRGAADWFRDAVRLRPENKDSRHNLEVILRRIIELADSLRKQENQDLAQRLDALIERQREMVGSTGELVDSTANEPDPHVAEPFRAAFRRLAVQQRQILSDSQALANAAREELESLEKKEEEERQPDETMRAAQLNNVLLYLNRANQRLSMARGQLRRRQGTRGFRRAATALDDLKRARDQLRNPVEVLGVIISDAAQLAGLTSELANGRRSITADASTVPESRAWLTDGYVGDAQQAITERTRELGAQLDATLQSPQQKSAGPPTSEQQQQQAAMDRLIEQVKQATPFVQKAVTEFENASSILGTGDEDTPSEPLAVQQLEDAGQHQIEAIQALFMAREQFLDIKGLIELIYGDEGRVQSLVAAAQESPEPPEAPMLDATKNFQDKNVDRGLRLSQLLNEAAAKLPPRAEDTDPQAQDTNAAAAEAERKRLDLAKTYLAGAQVEMSSAGQKLAEMLERPTPGGPPGDASAEKPSTTPPDSEPLDEVAEYVVRAMDHLSSLRRLFYSVVEHLRETAQRQAQLNDETEQVTTLQKADRLAAELGPLAARQNELQSITEQIAATLLEQSQQQSAAPANAQSLEPDQQEMMQQAGQRIAEAAKLVADGGQKMSEAIAAMQTDAPDSETVRTSQDDALQKLAEALALLQPPQQQEQQQQQQDQQQQQSQDQQEQTGADPASLLQSVRDRDAQRRKDKKKQNAGEPVEKDW